MARKKAGFYSEDPISGSAFQLIIELDEQEMRCMSKSVDNGTIVSFEYFSLDKDQTEDWNDIFYEIKTISKLFNKTYKLVTCYFCTPESILVPEKFLTATSAEDYLNLIYGESSRMEVKYEKLIATRSFINTYRIKKSLAELLTRQFIIFQTSHVYTSLLNDVMIRRKNEEQLVKLQFYHGHFIMAIFKDAKIQMIQTFSFKIAEDAVYYIIRAAQQFSINTEFAIVELSGMIDLNTELYLQLKKVYENIEINSMEANGIMFEVNKEYPPHYFAPFFKLAL
ncbi:MAG TPA: DUF3822 family protein [Sediminibacterium sp.]|uniref:DUF3822 family protein n=1 Tax=Sediminibacterium sp. TaxID=1917865 RepID=UPI0008D76351|nr:DUF3822 family protein [Sediminibacterium sp.]MBT9485085.1 DUF3822 family protein [Sediminibacterium sp.]OHC84287.1 MAG: hypothetical protein A2472_12570 [Sphingobacteriia bacterium RIFOXYC2_FULL_35_18]OHC88763.1 MAG: hypothetical protein A2546_02610 [Sphingobacteriia bacterium RIFOXYD2_FULL_35_12]HLD53898.1 DUF3822 family protein [Sediminibacterium sp.]